MIRHEEILRYVHTSTHDTQQTRNTIRAKSFSLWVLDL